MIVGGLVVSLIGFSSALIIRSYASTIPMVIGIVGILWIFVGTDLAVAYRLFVRLRP